MEICETFSRRCLTKETKQNPKMQTLPLNVDLWEPVSGNFFCFGYSYDGKGVLNLTNRIHGFGGQFYCGMVETCFNILHD